MNDHDRNILRPLAEQVAAISADKKQEEKRKLWRQLNALKKTRPMIHAFLGPWDAGGTEVAPQDALLCKDPVLRGVEYDLRFKIFKDDCDDDEIIEPWVDSHAIFECYGFGLNPEADSTGIEGGAVKYHCLLNEEADLEKLAVPFHKINEQASNDRFELISDAIGDIITINKRRGSVMSANTLSVQLASLVGIEDILYGLCDKPEFMHKMMTRFRDGTAKVMDEASAAGDWGLADSWNQSMAYCEGLPDPKANANGVDCSQLWGFANCQEFSSVSPEMTEEFLLDYQKPLLERYGLVAYGCCEDLTYKIDSLRQIKNLRRIGVTPWANPAKCAEQIKTDYVYSWRPHPAPHICRDWDPAFIEKDIKESLKIAQGCYVDIMLKDVQTLHGELWRVKEWVKIVREASAGF